MSDLLIGATLRALRKSKGYTQKYVGNLLNISRQAYSNYENNKRTPDYSTLTQLAKHYNISLDHLLHSDASVVLENTGPYHLAIDVVSGETIYLTEAEKKLVDKFRSLSTSSRSVLFGYLDSQIQDKKS